MIDNLWDAQYDDPRRYRVWPSEDLIRFLSGAFGPGPLEQPGLRALDLGCGAGGNLWALLWWGFDAYGIDTSPVARALAAKTVSERIGRTSPPVYYGGVEVIPFPPDFFDVIVDSMTLQHLVEPTHRATALWECERVLRTGGRILSVHLIAGTDYESTFPGVPPAFLVDPEDLAAEWVRAGFTVTRHITVARTMGKNTARYSVLHLTAGGR